MVEIAGGFPAFPFLLPPEGGGLEDDASVVILSRQKGIFALKEKHICGIIEPVFILCKEDRNLAHFCRIFC